MCYFLYMNNDCKLHTNESTEQLKTAGLKITGARLELLDILKHAKKPLSIKEIARQMGQRKPDMVTLYRNAESLQNLGLVKQINFQDRQAYFELTDSHHHHLICEECGKISDVADCNIQNIQKEILKKSNFNKINRHSLEFFGLCKKCKK